MKKNTILAILALSLMSTGGVRGDDKAERALILIQYVQESKGKENKLKYAKELMEIRNNFNQEERIRFYYNMQNNTYYSFGLEGAENIVEEEKKREKEAADAAVAAAAKKAQEEQKRVDAVKSDVKNLVGYLNNLGRYGKIEIIDEEKIKQLDVFMRDPAIYEKYLNELNMAKINLDSYAKQKEKDAEEQKERDRRAAAEKKRKDEAAAAEKKRQDEAAAEQKRKEDEAAAEQKRKKEEQREKEEATEYFLQKVKGREDKVKQMIEESRRKNTLQDMKSYLKQAETFLQDDETYEDLSLNSGVKNLLKAFSDQMKEKIESEEKRKGKKETKKQEKERLKKEEKQAKDLEKAGKKDAVLKQEAEDKIQEMTREKISDTTETREENSDDHLNNKNKTDIDFENQNTFTDKGIEDQETDVGTDTEGGGTDTERYEKKRNKRTFDLSGILKKKKYSDDQETDGGTDTEGDADTERYEKKRNKRTFDLSKILKKKKYSEDQETEGGADTEGYDGDDKTQRTKRKFSLNFNVGSDKVRESNLKETSPAVIDFIAKFDEIVHSSENKNIVKLNMKKNVSNLLEDALSDEELEKEDKKDCIGVIVDGMQKVGVSATEIKNYIDGAVKKTSTPKDYKEYYSYNLFVKICEDNGMRDLKLWLPGESIPDYTRSITEQMPKLDIKQSKAIVKGFVSKVGPLIKTSHPTTFKRILGMLVLNSPLCEKTQSTFEITDDNIKKKTLHQVIAQNLKKTTNDIKKYYSQWVSINENKSISSTKKRIPMNLLKINAKKKYLQFSAVVKELKALIKEDFIRNNYPEEDLKTLEVLGTNKELTDISKKLQLEDKKSSGKKNLRALEVDTVKKKGRIPAKKKVAFSKQGKRIMGIKKLKERTLELPEVKKPAAKSSAKIDWEAVD